MGRAQANALAALLDVLPEKFVDALGDVVAAKVVALPWEVHLFEVFVVFDKFRDDLQR